MISSSKKLKKSVPEKDQIFSNVEIYLFPVNMGDLLKSRRDVFLLQVQIRGGVFIQEIISEKCNNLIIIMPEPCSKETALEHLPEFVFKSDCTFLKTEWISECLRCNKLVNKEFYRHSLDPIIQKQLELRPVSEISPTQDLGEEIRIKNDEVKKTNGFLSPQKSTVYRNQSSPSSLDLPFTREVDWNSLDINENCHSERRHSLMNNQSQSSTFAEENISIVRKASMLNPNFKKNLACQLTRSNVPTNLNSKITSVLSRLQGYNEALSSKSKKSDVTQYKYSGIKKSIGILKKLNYEVTSSNLSKLSTVNGIGKKTIEKISEIINTGSLSRLNLLEENEEVKVIELFSKIWGVGPATAAKFYEMGFKDLKSLENSDVLINRQRIGLKYYDEIQLRMDRSEAELFETTVVTTAKSIPNCSDVIGFACGSYRRGKPTCGDIDIIFTHHSWKVDVMKPVLTLRAEILEFLSTLVHLLHSAGILTDDLQMPSEKPSHRSKQFHVLSTASDNRTNCTYMGMAVIQNGVHRRIDIKAYPASEFPFALLYFTGSDHFNRSMRWYCKKLGYSLSDHGISKAIYFPDKSKILCGDSIPCATEEAIFDLLDLEYVHPTERNAYDQFDLPTEEKDDNQSVASGFDIADSSQL